MIELMLEVEDVDIFRPVNDMKKMEVFILLRTEGTEGGREWRRYQGSK